MIPSSKACQIVTRIVQDAEGMHIGEEECGLPGIVRENFWICRECAVALALEGDILRPDLEAVVLVLCT